MSELSITATAAVPNSEVLGFEDLDLKDGLPRSSDNEEAEALRKKKLAVQETALAAQGATAVVIVPANSQALT